MKHYSRISPLYPLALWLTWAIHDAEELRDMTEFVPPAPLPRPSAGFQAHMHRAVKVMGLLLLGTMGLGAASGGRHPFFRAAVRANLIHALWHVGISLLLGRSTPGVKTAGLLVLPSTVLTERALAKAEVSPPTAYAYALFPLALALVHGLTALFTSAPKAISRAHSRWAD